VPAQLPSARPRLAAAIAALVVAAAIFAASSLPLEGMPSHAAWLYSLAHAVEYAILAALLAVALGAPQRRLLYIAATAIVIASAYGVSDELHQWFVLTSDGSHARSTDWRDWLVDTLGATCGAAIAIFAIKRRRQIASGYSDSVRSAAQPEVATAKITDNSAKRKDPAPRHETVRRRLSRLILEAAKFGAVGAAAFIVDNAVYFLLVDGPGQLFEAWPVRASIVASTVATAFSYIGNRYWTFAKKGTKMPIPEILAFAVANIVGIAITGSCLYISRWLLDFHSIGADAVARNLGIALGTVFRYMAYKFWVFNGDRTRKQ
jgi:putative flippase GtrA/VanZ family protein